MDEKTKQAVEMIKQVCAAFNGNLEQHKNIQSAVMLIEKELSGSDDAKDKK